MGEEGRKGLPVVLNALHGSLICLIDFLLDNNVLVPYEAPLRPRILSNGYPYPWALTTVARYMLPFLLLRNSTPPMTADFGVALAALASPGVGQRHPESSITNIRKQQC